MAEVNDLEVTDASNTARFPENQAPSTVNNGARSLEGMIARWHKDTNGSVAVAGTNTYTATLNTDTGFSLYDGFEFSGDFANANTGAATINLTPHGGSALGAKAIKKNVGTALASGDIAAGAKVSMIYDGTNFQMTSPIATVASAGISNVVEDTSPQLGGQLDVNGQALGSGTLELLKFSETGSAVNEFTIANAATGNGPTLSATGDNTNVDINISAKGSGVVAVSGSMNPSLTSTGKALVLGF